MTPSISERFHGPRAVPTARCNWLRSYCSSPSHFPTGASKWNPIEHRLFSEISKRWAGQPLNTCSTVVNLIGTTTTQTGLHVRSQLITKHYPTDQNLSDLNKERTQDVRQKLAAARNEERCDTNFTHDSGKQERRRR